MAITQLEKCQHLLERCKSSKGPNDIVFHRLFASQLNSFIRDTFVTQFWSHFKPDTTNKFDHCAYKPFLDAVEFLGKTFEQVGETLRRNRFQDLKEKLVSGVRTQTLSSIPSYLNEYVRATYYRAFKIYLLLERQKERAHTQDRQSSFDGEAFNEDDVDDDYDDDYEGDLGIWGNCCDNCSDQMNRCPGCFSLRKSCACESIYERFCRVNDHLRDLDLLEGLIGNTVLDVLRTFIERKVSIKCKGNYSCSYLDDLKSWTQKVVKSWAISVYKFEDQKRIQDLGQQLGQFLKDGYADARVSHLFEIIIEYPSSDAAIQDLRLCLEESSSSNFRINLIRTVERSLTESLLHPGVNTYDILTAYISAIKALRALDPSGLVLQLVTEPVRRYLKSRDDTVRCIVTALTDEDSNSELNREMMRSGAHTNENGLDDKRGAIEMSLPNEGEKCTASNFEKWKPDPIKVSQSDEQSKSNRYSDIVSTLVNIYETKNLFVEEYQKLLSQRLLNKYDDCNLDTELRNLELLTIRFSDCELHRCEVMLKDVQTSKRINKRIRSGDIRDHRLTSFRNLDALIVSSPFWPEKFSPMASLSDEQPQLKFPPEIEAAIETYTKAFEAIQASRTLHWRYHLGFVNMDVTINGKVQNFTVSPLHASILYLFKDKKTWRLEELMHKTSLPAATIRSRLALWRRNGLIRDCGGDKYKLLS